MRRSALNYVKTYLVMYLMLFQILVSSFECVLGIFSVVQGKKFRGVGLSNFGCQPAARRFYTPGMNCSGLQVKRLLKRGPGFSSQSALLLWPQPVRHPNPPVVERDVVCVHDLMARGRRARTRAEDLQPAPPTCPLRDMSCRA